MSTPRLHQSLAHLLISKSPLHAWQKAFHPVPEEYDAITTRGQIAHSLLLGGSRVQVIEADSWRTNAAKEAREAARLAGKLPILRTKLEDVQELISATLDNLERCGIVLEGSSELTLQWESNGVACEGTLDHLILGRHKATILDFKSCELAHPAAIARSMLNYGADIQEAAYRECVETLNPELAGRVDMFFIYIEVGPPYAMTVARQSGMMRALGSSKWGRAKERWKECLAKYGTDKPWPSYSDEVVPIDPPAWAVTEDIAEWQIEERQEENTAS